MPTGKSTSKSQKREEDLKAARDEANKKRFVEQSGLEASELPDKGRPTGHNDTPVDIGRRNLPQQHGGEQPLSKRDDFTAEADGGVRGDRTAADADDHGGRKQN